MLLLLDPIDQRIDGPGFLAQSPGRRLAMEDIGGDVGIIGGELAPADAAVLQGRAHEGDESRAEGFEALDPHECLAPWSDIRSRTLF
jgi:hypothetical protein